MALALLAGCGSDSEPQRAATTTETQKVPDLAPPSASREPPPSAIRQPKIVNRPIPFPSKRKNQMAAYAQRHYGIDDYRLTDPQVIVQHITVTPDFDSVYNTFANNTADPELGELPGVCAHYVIDKDGTIYELVPTTIMCRHTVGLNYTSIGIEHVAQTDAELLNNKPQLRASQALTDWLTCEHSIDQDDVIGHNESLSSPHHTERVARLRTQTHGDMTRASMRVYKRKLSGLRC